MPAEHGEVDTAIPLLRPQRQGYARCRFQGHDLAPAAGSSVWRTIALEATLQLASVWLWPSDCACFSAARVSAVSPACAITTTGFPIDRAMTADLLGFEGLVENSYDAIAGIDYLTGAAGALAAEMENLGRLGQDLLLRGTAEYGFLRLPGGYGQTSSIMHQKRNPGGLEHARAQWIAVGRDADHLDTGVRLAQAAHRERGDCAHRRRQLC